MTSKFFANIKQHIQSAAILRNNPGLLQNYHMGASSLYTLDRQQQTVNPEMQADYNKLHPAYKYPQVLDRGMPWSILLADPSYIKHLKVYGSSWE
jgi:hypothetical protein